MRSAVQLLVVLFFFGLSSVSSLSAPQTGYVEGEVLVKYKRNVKEADARTAVARHNISVHKSFEWLTQKRNQCYFHLKSETKTTLELIALLAKDPNIEAISPNYIRLLNAVSVPNDSLFAQQWGLKNTGQSVNGSTGQPDSDIDAPEAWSLRRDATGEVIVAILDTGVDSTHPDLADAMWVNPGETADNGIDDDGNGYVDDVYGYDFSGDGTNAPDSDPLDIGEHGTHVAGIASAIANNGIGIAGVSRAKIMALKASTDGETVPDAVIIEAVEYATMMKSQFGVPIVAINMSFGSYSYSQVQRDAIEEAGNAGIIACCAAGNDSNNNDSLPLYPSGYSLTNIISVAATDSNDGLASFSSYGAATVDLAAPGVNIKSSIPAHLGTEASVLSFGDTYSANPLGFAGVTSGITALGYLCGLGYTNNFPVGISGNIAIIQRGTLAFRTKVENAMNAGAVAVIIYNNLSGNFTGTLQVARYWIPAVSISQSDGLNLVSKGVSMVTVVNEVQPEQIYGFMNGTSMSCPFVTGAAGFMAEQYPSDNMTQRISRIMSSVDHIPALQSLMATGGRLNIHNPMDTDGDSLADWWEVEHFSGLTNATQATDSDGDGFSDYSEFVAGTDPTNDASYLQMLRLDPQVTNGIVIKWTSVTNKTYALYRATNLLAGFSPIDTNIPGRPPENAYVDTSASGSPVFFYRITVE